MYKTVKIYLRKIWIKTLGRGTPVLKWFQKIGNIKKHKNKEIVQI